MMKQAMNFSHERLFLKKHKAMIKFMPLSKKGVLNLYQKINSHPSKYSLYLLYIKVFSNVFIITVMAMLLKLEFPLIIILILITLTFIPFVLIWHLNHELNMQEFHNLEMYLTQFILIFKSHQKSMLVLYELKNVLTGTLKHVVNQTILNYEAGCDSEAILEIISDHYPHFIVYNLHVLILNVEKYGSKNYTDGLDLIQDDIDDWSEDMMAYDRNKKDIIHKVNILLCFAFIICMMALKMLFAVSLNTKTQMYQFTMFTFCLIEIMTYVMTQSMLNTSFMQKSETLC